MQYERSPVHGVVRGRAPCPRCGIRAWKWRHVGPSDSRSRHAPTLVCEGCDTPRGEAGEWMRCPQCGWVRRMPGDDEPICCLNCDWVAYGEVMDFPLSQEQVRRMIEGLRARGELGFSKEEDFRAACTALDKSELIDVLAMYWKKGHRH